MLSVMSRLPKSSNHILPFSFPKYTSKLNEDVCHTPHYKYSYLIYSQQMNTPTTLSSLTISHSISLKPHVLLLEVLLLAQYKSDWSATHDICWTFSHFYRGSERSMV